MADADDLQITTTIKKAGGSLLMTVPAPARDALGLKEGQEMTVTVEEGRLVYQPAAVTRRRSKYTLAELLAQCSPEVPLTDEERRWLKAPPVGKEIW